MNPQDQNPQPDPYQQQLPRQDLPQPQQQYQPPPQPQYQQDQQQTQPQQEQPQQQYQQPPALKVDNPLSVMESGEKNIFELKRHPIGMIGTFITAGLLLIVVAVLAFVVTPLVDKNNRSQALEIGGLVFAVVALLTLGFVYISNKIYWGNHWVLTSDSLTQVLQRGLFDKQSSQLSLGNLEDVTAEQNGMFSQMFKYGVLRVETAGDHSKFVFAYCPNPNYYAQEILRAREAFEGGRSGEDEQRPYRAENAYANSYSGQQPAQPQFQQQPQPPQQYQQPDQPVDPGVNIDTNTQP